MSFSNITTSDKVILHGCVYAVVGVTKNYFTIYNNIRGYWSVTKKMGKVKGFDWGVSLASTEDIHNLTLKRKLVFHIGNALKDDNIMDGVDLESLEQIKSILYKNSEVK